MTLDKGIRIVSDGTRHGTRIYDVETGEQLLRVKALSIDMDVAKTGFYHAVLTMHVPFEYEGPAEIVTEPEKRDE